MYLELSLRIDWSDLDTYEHVNNVSIIRYLQSARVQFWEQSGLHESYKKTNRGPMLVSTQCDFKKSLFYPGFITIRTRVAFLKNSSFSLEHIILNEKQEVCVHARDVAVCFDFTSETTYRIPEETRNFMGSYSASFKEI